MRILGNRRLGHFLVLFTLCGGCTAQSHSASDPLTSTSEPAYERIVTFRGFNRNDVPNFSLHVMKTPSLELVKRIDVDLDTMVKLDSIGSSGVLRAKADNTPRGVFSLDSHYQLREIREPDIPEEAFGVPWPQPRVILSDDRVTITLRDISHVIPLLFKNSGEARDYRVFNRGRSLIVRDGATSLHLIRDISSPVKEKLEGLSEGQLAVDPEAPYFFVAPPTGRIYDGWKYSTANTSRPEEVYGSARYVTRVDSETGVVSRAFFQVDDDFHGHIFACAKGTLLLGDYEGPLKLIDVSTGTVRGSVAYRERGNSLVTSFEYAGRTYAVLGDNIVDIDAGKVVARLSGHFPICAVAPSPDGRYVVFSALEDWDKRTDPILRTFDMRLRKVVAETKLANVGSQWGEAAAGERTGWSVGVLYLCFGPGGHVLAFSGTQVQYMDHMHVHSEDSTEESAPDPVVKEPQDVGVLRGTLSYADKYASQVDIGSDTRMIFLVEDATIDGKACPPVLLTTTYWTSVCAGSDGSTENYKRLAVGQRVVAHLEGLDSSVFPVDAIAHRIEIP